MNAEQTSIATLERVISFLKTEQARGTKGMPERISMVEMALKNPSVRHTMGMVIVDHILAQPRIDMVFETTGEPNDDGSTE